MIVDVTRDQYGEDTELVLVAPESSWHCTRFPGRKEYDGFDELPPHLPDIPGCRTCSSRSNAHPPPEARIRVAIGRWPNRVLTPIHQKGFPLHKQLEMHSN